MPRLVIAAVVTENLLREHLLLRKSFELFHDTPCEWVIRCDAASAGPLSRLPKTTCEVFTGGVRRPTSQWSQEFRDIVEQKMLALRDAWEKHDPDAVLFLDSDIVVTDAFVGELLGLDAELVLTPHYFAGQAAYKDSRYGRYNSGFVFTRTPAFHRWWREEFHRQPESFTDQACLNGVEKVFRTVAADHTWNVGYWRRKDPWDVPELPRGMKSFHAHLFQEARPDQEYELGQKAFAPALLDFLRDRGTSRDRELLDYVLSRDESGYYSAMLERKIDVLTHCDPGRAVRLYLMARTLPKQVTLICALNGSADEVRRRLLPHQLPSNVRLVERPPLSPYPTNALRNAALNASRAEWVFYIDVDFVFQKGFWYRLFQESADLLEDGHCLCPLPLWDPEGEYLNVAASSDILAAETPEQHRPPETWGEADRAKVFKFHEMWLGNGAGGEAPRKHLTGQMKLLRHSLHPAEPWGLLRRSRCVLADEDFRGRVRDKQQFVSALLDRGVDFISLSNLFVFHLWHPDSRAPEDRPELSYNYRLWQRRYNGKGHKYLFMNLPGCGGRAVDECVRSALSVIYHGRYLSAHVASPGAGAGADPPADADDSARRDCLRLMREGVHYIEGPVKFWEEFLGLGYRIFAVIRDPVLLHLRRLEEEARRRPSAPGRTSSVEEYIGRGLVSDGWLCRYFAGPGGSLVDAANNLSEFSFVLDTSQALRSASVLRNVLGLNVSLGAADPDAPPAAAAPFSEAAYRELRERIPQDYELYCKAQELLVSRWG